MGPSAALARVYAHMISPENSSLADVTLTERDRVALAIRVLTLGLPVDPVASVAAAVDVVRNHPGSIAYPRDVSKHPIAYVYTMFAMCKAVGDPAGFAPPDAEYCFAGTPGGARAHAMLLRATRVLDVAEAIIGLVLGGETGADIAAILWSALITRGYGNEAYSATTANMLNTARDVVVHLWNLWNNCPHTAADAAPLHMAALFLALWLAHVANRPAMPLKWNHESPEMTDRPPSRHVYNLTDYVYPNTEPIRLPENGAATGAAADRMYREEYALGAEYAQSMALVSPDKTSFFLQEVPPDEDVFEFICRVRMLPPEYVPVVTEMHAPDGRLCPWRVLQTIESTPDNTPANRDAVAAVDNRTARWTRFEPPDAARAAVAADIARIGAHMPEHVLVKGVYYIREVGGMPCDAPPELRALTARGARFVLCEDRRVRLVATSLFR